MTVTYHKNTHSYLPASYVKWIEMNNARVIPIPYDTPTGALDMILNQVNGVLFIGGQVDHGMISEEYVHFMETFKHIVNHAKKSNNQKNYFLASRFIQFWGTMRKTQNYILNIWICQKMVL